jgi:predicted lipid-binding transport protein (Tim44 family)
MQAVQFIDIIFLAMVAGFIILRLRSTLGRRNGHEQKPKPKTQSDNVINLVVEDDAKSNKNGNQVSNDGDTFSKILAVDGSFSSDEFLKGAEQAFELIVNAFGEHDKSALKPLLSAQVYKNFESVIDERISSNYFIKTELIKLDSPKVNEVSVNGLKASISVAFASEQINTRVEMGAKTVEEDSSDPIESVIDLWTFEHDFGKEDPNWLLVSTRTLDD